MNWLPWSVLKIPGLPYFASASSRAATQNETSIVFDNRHARTARLAQSMIALIWFVLAVVIVGNSIRLVSGVESGDALG